MVAQRLLALRGLCWACPSQALHLTQSHLTWLPEVRVTSFGIKLALFCLPVCSVVVAAAAPPPAPFSARAAIPANANWIAYVRLVSAKGSPSAATGPVLDIERSPQFKQLAKVCRTHLGIRIEHNVQALTIFGTTVGPGGKGVFAIGTTAKPRTIIAALKGDKGVKVLSYDGINIYKFNAQAQHSPGQPPIYVSVPKPGLVLGSRNKSLFEDSLNCVLGVSKPKPPQSALFSHMPENAIGYVCLTHVQQLIDKVQNPLDVPPPVRKVKSIWLAIAPGPGGYLVQGKFSMLSPVAAMQTGNQLRNFQRIFINRASGANANDHQMVMAGLIHRLKITNVRSQVLIHWSLPRRMLRSAAATWHKGAPKP